jgi:valyl-tRNA synthetase
MLDRPEVYRKVFPMSLRPQAHEIIRTWAFDTIVMSQYRYDVLPWKDVLISGWGLAAAGSEKISKSRGGGPMAPMAMLERYSADAARYWAASTGPGKDALISEGKIGAGAKLVTKLWNVAGFASRFLEGHAPAEAIPALSPADRWIMAELQALIARVTDAFERYEYATAKSETETFFWRVLADNYLEMAKKRLYDAGNPGHEAARWTLRQALLGILKLFAPILPYITEEIFQHLFAMEEGEPSIHRARWPKADERLISAEAIAAGEALVEVANAVRRYKSDRQMSLGAELACLQVAVDEPALAAALEGAGDDIASVTRAREVIIGGEIDASLARLETGANVPIAVAVRQ